MKTLISKSDFITPYPTLSPNLAEAKINECVWRVQDTNLRELIGAKLYDDLLAIFEIERAISAITVGAQTTITLNSVADLEIGYFASFKGVVGTVSDLLNGKQFEIANIVGSTIILNVDSTGKTYTSGGTLEKVLTASYRVLYPYLVPYLIYGSYALHLQKGDLDSTASGIMSHQVGEAQRPTDKRIGENINSYGVTQRNYASRLLEFLRNNKDNYPLFNLCDVVKNETVAPTFLGVRTNRNLSNM